MTDLFFPAHLGQASTRLRFIDAVGGARNEYTGALRTAARGGERLGMSVDMAPVGGRSATDRANRAALIAHIMRMRGRQNRVVMRDDSYVRRGSFPAVEMLANHDFRDGVTGWTAQESALSALERGVRVTVRGIASGGPSLWQEVSLAAQVPYVGRGATVPMNVLPGSVGGVYFGAESYSVDFGYRTKMFTVAAAQSTQFYPGVLGGVPGLGATMDCHWASVSRCALVDNAPNAATHSDQLDNGNWVKSGVTVTADFHAAPDGTQTSDRMVENTNNGAHYITRTLTRVAAAEDWCVYGTFARNSGTAARDLRLVVGTDGSNYAACIFNLGTGTAGSVTLVGTVTNGRAAIVSLGVGRYACYLTATLTSTTSVFTQFDMANSGSVSYLGDGSADIAIWRFGAAKSAFPVRLGGTTTTALASGTAQTGNGLHLKGLPVSTQGLLEIGDQIEVVTSFGSELKIVTSRLNSDAAGLGYVQFAPRLRGAPANDAPVIIHQPMGRFGFVGDVSEWANEPGIFSSASFDFEEAVG